MHGMRRFVTTGLCLIVIGFGLYLVPATLGWTVGRRQARSVGSVLACR